jgi:hypothetical protein
MAKKNPGDQWIAISYDGKLTGSLEHRCYNHTKMVKFLKDTPPDTLSPIGMYAKEYDVTAGKSKEPNFDLAWSFKSSKLSLIFSLVLEPLSGANKIPIPTPIAAPAKSAKMLSLLLPDIILSF